MASCAYCGSWIVFGGESRDKLRYCNAECKEKGFATELGARLPQEMIAEVLEALHKSNCPKCGGPGTVDLHTSHRALSFVVITHHASIPEVCCRGCAIKSNIKNSALSLFFGWWGFPWGLIFTPIQITRNMIALCSMPSPEHPSPQLVNIARLHAAHSMMEEERAAQAEPQTSA